MKTSKRNQKKVVFIVDDQPLYATILQNAIEKRNHQVHLFETGEDCIANMNLNPDVIILDFELDDGSGKKMNGIQALKKIKEMQPDCEVVMLSGHEEVKIATTSIKFGAYDYVVKNENSIINIKNRIRNIYRKIDILTELKEVNLVKNMILGIVVVTCLFAAFSGTIFGNLI